MVEDEPWTYKYTRWKLRNNQDFWLSSTNLQHFLGALKSAVTTLRSTEMKSVLIEQVGGELKVAETPTPVPGPNDLLVKSLYIAFNPVEAFMIETGLLVRKWPLALAVDGSGIVVEVGENAAGAFKKGDIVCGCSRLGEQEYATGQEFHLRDSGTTIPKPENVSIVQAATIGGGYQTAAIGLSEGLKIPVPEKQHPKVGEWILVMGGAGSVGRATVQLLLLAGFDVVTTCSSRSKDDLESLGASTVDYKQPENDQIEAIQKITGGKISKIFDAAAANDPVVAKALFKQVSGEKIFVTTNDWSAITDFEGGKTYAIALGPIGSPEAKELNSNIAKYNAVIVKLFQASLLNCSEFEVIGAGLEGAIETYHYHKAGKGGNKRILVKIQDE